jgi:hypothetical protein
MSAFKQFLASDVIVTPFEVNKGFILPYSQWATGSDGQYTGIDRFIGTSGSFTTDKSTTGTLSTEYKVLVYNSIKELYYSNFISSSWGDLPSTSSIYPGSDSNGDVLFGPIDSTGRYENYLQTTLTQSRSFPTQSGAEIGVLSIPSKLFGEQIVPDTFVLELDGTNALYDDGEGNVITSFNQVVGNIIYQHGITIFTFSGSINSPKRGTGYGSWVYGVNYYGGSPFSFNDLMTSTNVTCSFSSSYNIYETQYKTTLRESEFNFSQNPSIISSSAEGTVYDFVTSSYFSPYVTTVGLYNENQELLAVGKLAQPLPTSPSTDTSILINIDR